jgi:hypothetical protein
MKYVISHVAAGITVGVLLVAAMAKIVGAM